MKINSTFLIIILGLAAAGSWGVWKIADTNLSQTANKQSDRQQVLVVDGAKQQKFISLNNTTSNIENDIKRVKQWLSLNHNSKAIDYVNELYQELDSDQLNSFKQLFQSQALQYADNNELKKAQRLLKATSTLFNEVEILDLLASVSVELKDWRSALNALLESSLLESRPEVITEKLTSLANIASQIKKELAAISSFENIKKLYLSLYNAHPSYGYFQLELGLSYLTLNEINSAKTSFSAIQYDLDVGAQAQEQLALLRQFEEQKQIAETDALEKSDAKKTATNSNDITISLIRAGNSFLIDSTIENKGARLLLDTGASITALSPELISRLRLSPTGDFINLSTANGIAESQLYLAKRIKLGKITVRDLIVAEVNLGNSKYFEGLLGTDLLNKVGANYSYIIDNENNSLIFKRR